MEIDYLIIALVLIGSVLAIIFLIRKNRKDMKEFEKEMNQESIEPEQHKSNSI